MLVNLLANQKQALIKSGRYRERLLLSVKAEANFCSNDYLSLTKDINCQQGFQEGFRLYPCSSGSSMVIGGYHPIHQQLEDYFSHVLTVDRAILFNSGYTANLAIISLLKNLNQKILIDKMVHASIYDGLKLSQIDYKRLLHQNIHDLHKKIKKFPQHQIFISEAVFSMTGTALSSDSIQICKDSNRLCIIDEAHSFGILGQAGRGLTNQYHLDQDLVPLRIIPLGKAMAAQGAIVAGKAEWIELLVQYARSYIYTTGISPAYSYGILNNLHILLAADARRKKLTNLISYFRENKQKTSALWSDSYSPIQQLIIGCPHRVLLIRDFLLQKGIFVQAIREPTVPKGMNCLRVCLNYDHEPEHIDLLFKALSDAPI